MKVLVIQDLQYVIERINASLNKIKPDKIFYASNSSAAKSQLESETFDLIIMEVYIKSLTCLEAIKMAKNKNQDVAIIVITPLDAADIAEKSLKYGAYDFVIRPAQLDKLDSLLEIYSILKNEDKR